MHGQRRLYVLLAFDASAIAVKQFLAKEFASETSFAAIQAQHKRLLLNDDSATETCYLFTSTGKIPCAYTKRLGYASPETFGEIAEHAALRDITIPDQIQESVMVSRPGLIFALKPGLTLALPNVVPALRHLHLRASDDNGSWLGPKKKRASNWESHRQKKNERARSLHLQVA